MAMRICWRCGIKFDPRGFTRVAPCFDCQEVTNTVEESVTPWKFTTRPTKAQDEARKADLLYFTARQLTDEQIGKRLGVSAGVIWAARRKHGIVPNSLPPIYYTQRTKDRSLI